MCEDVSDRACTINGGEKGRDGEIFRRNEKESKRRGELSRVEQQQALVQLEWFKMNVKARRHGHGL
jgi:hypothetical protein